VRRVLHRCPSAQNQPSHPAQHSMPKLRALNGVRSQGRKVSNPWPSVLEFPAGVMTGARGWTPVFPASRANPVAGSYIGLAMGLAIVAKPMSRTGHPRERFIR